MKTSILISKKANMKVFADDYKIGWLATDDDQGLWLVFGSSKDLKMAIECAKDTIRKMGHKDVYLSEEKLDKFLTKEQIISLKKYDIDL